MPGIHCHKTLREMDAVIQRIPHQDRERYGLHDAQLPAETPKQGPQGQQDGYYGDDHGQDDPEVVRQDNDRDGTEYEGEEDPVKRTVHSNYLDVNLHPVVTGVEGSSNSLCTLV